MGPNSLALAVAAGLMVNGSLVALSENSVLTRRPYMTDDFGRAYVLARTTQRGPNGGVMYAKQYLPGPVKVNATLRKDEWVRVDEQLLTAFRERLVIVSDMRAAGLTFNVGGLGTIISEWETASEMTDAEITMDGESQADQDRQEFGLAGVPIPVVQKPFRIGERQLMASRSRGASLDVSMGVEAARSVARTSERLVFYGTTIGAQTTNDGVRRVYGLGNFPTRALLTVGDWNDETYTPADIVDDILAMIRVMETQHRRYGPFNLYVPGSVSFQFNRDFKAFGDRTLMDRVLAIPQIGAVRVADAVDDNDVFLVQMTSDTFDLGVASEPTTIQWASPSGWTNFFQNFAAWAPRIKSDFDDRVGYLHASLGS